ncbi:MAG: hypothetical protein IBJ03_15995 [Gemmatimonadaceae bacterium]|nr:hypothetical protein [Gemmatimonadaceae bacterium]
MTERRYGDDEVRQIFSLATTGDTRDQAPSVDADGLTLEEVQRIGAEAGIEPARVALAAEQIETKGRPVTVRRSFGLPIGVSRVVPLARAPTDREWELLVTEFRGTFEARGETTMSGGIREWSNGNLHIAVEPTAHGHQLRLSTLKDDAMVLNVVASLFTVMALVMGATIAAAGKPDKAIAIMVMFGGLGLAALGTNLIRLPRWARTRQQQLSAIAERTVKLLSNP